MQVVAEELDLVDRPDALRLDRQEHDEHRDDTDEARPAASAAPTRCRAPARSPRGGRRGAAGAARTSRRRSSASGREPPVSNGVVSGGGKSTTYGELVGGKLFNVKLTTTTLEPGEAPAKPVGQYKVVGHAGAARRHPGQGERQVHLLHNLKVPGHAARPGGAAARPGRLRHAARQAAVGRRELDQAHPGCPGRPQGRLPRGRRPARVRGVQAAAQLKVKWADGADPARDGNLFDRCRRTRPGRPTTASPRTRATSTRRSRRRRRSSRRSFEYHYKGHVPIGPGCAVADVTSGTAVVYSNTQNPHNRSRPRGDARHAARSRSGEVLRGLELLRQRRRGFDVARVGRADVAGRRRARAPRS